MNIKLVALGVLVAILAVVGSNALFTVHQTEQVLVVQFGDPQRVVRDPGLNIKLPFVQTLLPYEKRVLDLDPPAEQVILSDQKRLDVDAYLRWRIVDPLLFFQTLRNELNARDRLNRVLVGALRRVLGNVTLLDLLSDTRTEVMANIQTDVSTAVASLGIEVVDVRIRRADLPEATSRAIYDRMRSEREREAAEFRAQGEEQAQQIRSRADRERTVIIAEAQRDSDIFRGEGDQEAIRIYADAFGQDPEFYAFYRSLEAYRQSLAGSDTTLVLSPDSDFFQFFGNMLQGQGSGPANLAGATAVIEDVVVVEEPDQADGPQEDGAGASESEADSATNQ